MKIFKRLKQNKMKTDIKKNGRKYEVSTSKRHGGKLETTYTEYESTSANGRMMIGFGFGVTKEQQGTLISEKVSRVTQHAIKEQHMKALAILDEMEFEEKEDRKPEVGMKVVYYAAYMNEYHGWIYRITDRGFEYVHCDGTRTGSDDHPTPIEEKFGIGVYYDRSQKFEGSEEALMDLVIDAKESMKNEEINKQAEQILKNEETKNNLEALRKKYHYLTEAKEPEKNIRTILKREFPGIKFSVRKREYSSYSVTWIDGPTVKEVEQFTNLFDSGAFDAHEDYHSNPGTDFTSLFGGRQFQSVSREISEETHAKVLKFAEDNFHDRIFAHYGNYFESPEYYAYALQRKYNYPTTEFSISKGEGDLSNLEGAMVINRLDADTVKEVAPINETDKPYMVEYSEKAIAVFNSLEVKDELKKLGARFNRNLTNPNTGQKEAGWILSKKKTEEVKKILS